MKPEPQLNENKIKEIIEAINQRPNKNITIEVKTPVQFKEVKERKISERDVSKIRKMLGINPDTKYNINKLTKRQRQYLSKFGDEGYDILSIAKAFEVTPNTVKITVHSDLNFNFITLLRHPVCLFTGNQVT